MSMAGMISTFFNEKLKIKNEEELLISIIALFLNC
jgi:hypothetical protein